MKHCKKIIVNINNIILLIIYHSSLVMAAAPSSVLPSENLLLEKSKNSLEGPIVKLPYGDLVSEFIPQIIKIILYMTGSMVLAALVYAGVLLVTSEGKGDNVDKAKKIISYAVIGLIIMSAAYAITLGIAKLSFDTTT